MSAGLTSNVQDQLDTAQRRGLDKAMQTFSAWEPGDEKEVKELFFYVCHFCKQPYARDYGCVSHIEYKHWTPGIKPKENFTKVTLKEAIIEKYAKKGEMKTRFGCRNCGQKGMSRTGITGHLCIDPASDGTKISCVGHHPRGKTLIKNDRRLLFYTDKRCLLCPTCGAIFSEPLNLDIHLMNAHGIATERHRKHACVPCGKMFARKSGLDIHNLRVHTTDKPSSFVCDYCGQKFTSMNSLYCHRKYTHVSGRAFQCQYCPKKFYKRHLWITHTKRHLGEKPFPCKVCKKDFTSNANLINHMRTHTGDRPYKCVLCPANFIQQCRLDVHYLRKHSLKTPPPPDFHPGADPALLKAQLQPGSYHGDNSLKAPPLPQPQPQPQLQLPPVGFHGDHHHHHHSIIKDSLLQGQASISGGGFHGDHVTSAKLGDNQEGTLHVMRNLSSAASVSSGYHDDDNVVIARLEDGSVERIPRIPIMPVDGGGGGGGGVGGIPMSQQQQQQGVMPMPHHPGMPLGEGSLVVDMTHQQQQQQQQHMKAD